MAVPPGDFRIVKGQFFSLEPLTTDQDGWITAIAVTLEGILGCENLRRRRQRTQYRVVASVARLQSGLPVTWIVSPRDQDIQHVNIWRAREVCPYVGVKLPNICWGTSEDAWRAIPPAQRTLANFLEATRQLLSQANLLSKAR
jgi:hypothetical protein